MCIVDMDFTKAYDKVPNAWLVGEPFRSKICLEGGVRIIAEGYFSDWWLVTSGVLQGSVLDPLLLIIDINDLMTI